MSDDQARQAPRSNWVKIALLASLGLNLFFAGWWAGDLSRAVIGHGHGPRPNPMQDLTERLHGKLSAAGMAKVEALAHEIDQSFDRRREDPRQFRDRLKPIIAAEQFDPAGFDQVIDKEITRRAAFETGIARRIGEVLNELSPADRKVLVDMVLDRPPPPPGPPR